MDNELFGPQRVLWPPGSETQTERRSRYLGCLLGGAVGDALGAPVEFLSRSSILAQFGPEGITDYAPAYGRLGAITDDTQMTLFTAEGLLRSHVRDVYKGITTREGLTANAYLRWLHTQGMPTPLDERGQNSGWLIRHPALHSRRAPGNTCLSALAELRGIKPANNHSKGCGGVMRVAPAGLYGLSYGMATPQQVFELAANLAQLTHGHPSGYLSAGLLGVMVMALADGAQIETALEAGLSLLVTHEGHEETRLAIEKARELAAAGSDPVVAIGQLGQGWVAEEALAIAVYCSLVADSFEHGVVLSVNHDGDSDSTGAITGHILGTQYGVEAIPSRWLGSLELREVIAEIAEDLLVYPDWPIGEDSPDEALSERIWDKYPGF